MSKLKMKPKPGKESREGKKKTPLNVRLKREEESNEKGITYNTTLIDRLSSKISFESLDVSSNFSIHDDTAFAKDGYMRVYNIIKYPITIMYTEERGFLSSVLNSIKNIKELETGVDFYYECFSRPYTIRFDQKTKRRYEGLERMEQRLRDEIEQKNDNKNMTSRDRDIKQVAHDALEFRLTEVKKKKNTYDIIRANQNRGRAQIESFQFIRVVCDKKSNLEIAEDKLLAALGSVDIQVKKVKDITLYLETFSPVSCLNKINVNNEFASTIFTTSSYSKIRNKPTRILENELRGLSRLVFVGTDTRTFEPLPLSFTSSGQGQNILIIGKTGSGKTYIYEHFGMSTVLNGFRLNAMDYKGNEYKALADVIPNSIILDFSMDSPMFINTLKFIPELYPKEDWDKAFANNSEATVQGLRILAGIKGDLEKEAENALEYIITEIYKKYNIFYGEPETYFRTYRIDYFRDIGEAVRDLHNNNLLSNTFGSEVCRRLYSGLAPYFSPTSHRSRKFTVEFDLKDILEKDCIIYSYNMNTQTPWDPLLEHKIYSQDYVTNLYIQNNKKLGISTINSLEEYQRAVGSEDARVIYNNKLSGGRSDNVINVVISNTIRPLLDKSNDISAIRENIATIVVGKLQDMDALEDFAKVYGLTQEDRIEIQKVQKMTHAFYIKYDTGAQSGGRIIKALHPDYISKFFETKKIDEATY